MHSASNPADAFPPTSSKMAYSTPVHIHEDLCERGQLQDPFCNQAAVRIWAAVISTFIQFCNEVQLHLIDYQWMYASDYSCAKIISFSAALILFSLSTTILLSDFAAEHIFAHVSQVKATCFYPKWKQKRQKEVNFQPISFKKQLPEVIFKPITTADKNVVRQAEFYIPNFTNLVLLMC